MYRHSARQRIYCVWAHHHFSAILYKGEQFFDFLFATKTITYGLRKYLLFKVNKYPLRIFIIVSHSVGAQLPYERFSLKIDLF